ncbi:hypothetical protein Nepgr_032178 [Nepenthes gracilis]|uniref:Protein kinase domain-containing protein n=1 Tax=Nepenthes gracilis TaxID=150966 RepID=A0AAD3TI49_NEPGR|nr:hypothetical protein Nepgr_032178 [Nepenthes gracilis]
MRNLDSDAFQRLVLGFLLIFPVSFSGGYTDPRDVFAINSLYAALGSPPLPRWAPIGGDPCMEAWQGVLCVNANITGISLNGANLGGELGTNLDSFASIISIDLTDNHIGGTIPSNLPLTIRTFFLSANQFIGSIPDSLSTLTQLTDLSLNNNNLTGEIPDAFQQLSGLINLDLSSNNFSGPLPSSMGNLSSLTTLHLQDNKLIGTLNVLQDLPLINLDIENNQFSGPIPAKLLSIPSFRSTGNPFNTSVLPSPPAPAIALPPNSSLPWEPSPPHGAPTHQEKVPSSSQNSNSVNSGNFLPIKRTIWSAIAVGLILVIIALGSCLCISRFCRKRHERGASGENGGKSEDSKSLPPVYKQTWKSSKQAAVKTLHGSNADQIKEIDVVGVHDVNRSKDHHAINMTGTNVSSDIFVEEVNIKPKMPTEISVVENSSLRLNSPSSAKSFTVALLQQYTDSFSQENFIGEGILGSVYRAGFPDGELVAVKKLNTAAARKLSDNEFVQLVSSISKLHHENIVKLIGYCAEYGQRLFVYEYCSMGTLYDALHFDDEIHKKLSWNARIKIALEAARALEYLHEVCKPPVVHKNFKSANILLDDKLSPRMSDCGFALLFSDGFSSQLAGQLSSSGYNAPELELGSYTQQSDIFSYGVVMLELLTGQKPYDRSRPRGQQSLVQWAIPRLHDIDALSKMVDPSLYGSYPSKSLSRFADTISLCVQCEPKFRPPMSEIVNLLRMVQRES